MSIIQWGVDLFTGLPEVDQQHNQLVALANRLSEVDRNDPEVLEAAFRQLQDYVLQHFSLEERLMDETQISAEHIRYHKQAHALFVARVTALWQARNSAADKTWEELLAFLTSWILQHILHTDRRMAQEIHAKLGTEAPHNMFTHF